MKKRIIETYKYYGLRAKNFVTHNILHADDPPHPLALGVAIAMFVTFTPTIGIQMFLVFVLAWIFRANKLVGLPLVWISNPATAVPIFYPCYKLGLFVLGLPAKDGDWFANLKNPPDGAIATAKFYWNSLEEIAVPLWVGSVLVAFVLGIVSYYITYWGVCAYRMRKWGQLIPPPMTTPVPPRNQDSESDEDDSPPTPMNDAINKGISKPDRDGLPLETTST